MYSILAYTYIYYIHIHLYIIHHSTLVILWWPLEYMSNPLDDDDEVWFRFLDLWTDAFSMLLVCRFAMLFRYAPLTCMRPGIFGYLIFRFVLLCLSPDCDLMSDENVKLLCDTFYLRVPSPGFDPVIFRLGSKYANRSAKLPRLSSTVLMPCMFVRDNDYYYYLICCALLKQ